MNTFKQLGTSLSAESTTLIATTLTWASTIITIILSSSITTATEITSSTLWLSTEVSSFAGSIISINRCFTFSWCSIATCWWCFSGDFFSSIGIERCFSYGGYVIFCIFVICSRSSTITWLRFVCSTWLWICLSLCCNVFIERIKGFCFGTIKIEPPITDEIILVEYSSIGAEERVLSKSSLTISSTDVKYLAVSFGISIVS